MVVGMQRTDGNALLQGLYVTLILCLDGRTLVTWNQSSEQNDTENSISCLYR